MEEAMAGSGSGWTSMSKDEEVMELKSLRRVISAYLNYAVAMEEDVKRWERSYKRLPPAHKELLSHLPKKYKDVRSCLSANFFFILSMLQDFEPPFDMSQHNEVNYEGVNASMGHMCSHSDGHLTEQIDRSTSSDANQTLDHVQTSRTSGQSPSQNESSPKRFSEIATDFDQKDPAPIEGLKEVSGSSENGKMVDSIKNPVIKKTSTNAKKIKICGMDFQDPALQLHVPPSDVDKVRCMIRNLVRDWTEEGALEREQCYKPILEELNHCFPNRSAERPPCCLVPGAGLGRLACEISCLGFVCQGNEFSYYVLICSSFILNNTQAPLEWVIYPWIHSNCNMLSDENQLRPVCFPDLHPGSSGITDGFSMCAGDFVEIYNNSSQEGAWDAVVTCFFIDTAHNIVEYIEIIARILKPGGVWINLGPLLYHFADAVSYSGEEEMSIELSLEDVKKVASHYGLNLQKERFIETTYTANQRSMIQTRYTAAFWTMRKDDVVGAVKD